MAPAFISQLFGGTVQADNRPTITNDHRRHNHVAHTNNNGNRDVQKPVALPFTTIGSWSKEVLYGARGQGVYLSDHQLGWQSRTSTGTSFSVTGLRKGEGITATVLGTHVWAAPAHDNKPGAVRTVTVMAGSDGSLDVEGSNMVHGVRASSGFVLSSGALPGGLLGLLPTGLTSTGKSPLAYRAGIELLNNQYMHLKGTTTLDKMPVVALSVGTGIGNLQLGADLAFSASSAAGSATDAGTAAQQVKDAGDPAAQPSRTAARTSAALVGGLTRWTAALGWQNQDQQVALSLASTSTTPDNMTAKLQYATKLNEGVLLGAEVARDVDMKGRPRPLPLVFAVGASARATSLAKVVNENNRDTNIDLRDVSPAALLKAKLDSTGTLALLYSDRLHMGNIGSKGGDSSNSPRLQLTGSVLINVKDPFAALPRVGVSLELVQ